MAYSKIRISKGKQETFLPIERLAAICLELCGGGYSALQTANAMALQGSLLAGAVGKVKGFTLQLIP